MTNDELILELRRQASMRNATWPCVLLKDLLPLLDEYERLREADHMPHHPGGAAGDGEVRS